MKNKVKIAKFIVIGLIVIAVMMVFYDYLDTEVLKYLNERESIIKPADGIDKYVSPLSIKNFLINLKENDENAVGEILIEEDNYIYSTYYDLLIIPKSFKNIDHDILSEVVISLEQDFDLEALISSLNANFNSDEIKDLVKKLKAEEFNSNSKGLIIDKTSEYLRIKRNMTY